MIFLSSVRDFIRISSKYYPNACIDVLNEDLQPESIGFHSYLNKVALYFLPSLHGT